MKKDTISKEELNRLMNVDYPIVIYPVDEDDGGRYYFAYLPDFGWQLVVRLLTRKRKQLTN